MPEIIPNHIVISAREDLDFWCRYFNCTPKDLEDAINKMGTCTDEVTLYLSERPGKKGLSFWWEYMQ